jgi:hypothetical protein
MTTTSRTALLPSNCAAKACSRLTRNGTFARYACHGRVGHAPCSGQRA